MFVIRGDVVYRNEVRPKAMSDINTVYCSLNKTQSAETISWMPTSPVTCLVLDTKTTNALNV